MLTIGSLFSGIGGLELGLEWAGLGPVLWQAENAPFPRSILAKHWPHAKRYEDVRAIDATAERPDVICGGFPCQDISNAGQRAGIDGERSGLWSEYARIIGALRPRFVVVENVAALLGRGMGRVLGDLSEIGYDAEWTTIRASDVGAPHRRERVFIVAYPRRDGGERRRGLEELGIQATTLQGQVGQQRVRDTASHCRTAMADPDSPRRGQLGVGRVPEDGGTQPGDHADGCGGARNMATPTSRDWKDGACASVADAAGTGREGSDRDGGSRASVQSERRGDAGGYGWPSESGLGRDAHGVPNRVDRWPARPNERQAAWEPPRVITSRQVARSHRLKALGNAVVPQVGEVAGRRVMWLAGL